jgi:hypothetical protein
VKSEAPERHEPGRAPAHRTIRANVYFLAEAQVAYVFSLDEGDAAGEETFNFDRLVVRTTLVLTVRDGRVIDVRPDSETKVFPSASGYGDNWDAAEAIVEALECIPGLEFPGDREDGWGTFDQEITVEGVGEQVRLSWLRRHEGELWVTIDDAEAHVICGYDSSTWIGGMEGMYSEPPYFLQVETDRQVDQGAWPLAAWVLGRLLEDEPAAE